MATPISHTPQTCPVAAIAATQGLIPIQQCFPKYPGGFYSAAQQLANGIGLNHLANSDVFQRTTLPGVHKTWHTQARALLGWQQGPKVFVRHSALSNAPNSPYLNGLEANTLAQLKTTLGVTLAEISQAIDQTLGTNSAATLTKLNTVLVDDQEMLHLLGQTNIASEENTAILKNNPVWLQSNGILVLNAEQAMHHGQLRTTTHLQLLRALFQLATPPHRYAAPSKLEQQVLQEPSANVTEKSQQLLALYTLEHTARALGTLFKPMLITLMEQVDKLG